MKHRTRLALLGFLTLAAIVIVGLLKPISQSHAFHSFADQRIIAGIPNFWNVMSNIPFVVIGIYGLILIGRSHIKRSVALIYAFLFIGILFTGIGSAYYHYNPNNDSLVYDRLPMTVVFMSFLAATISEYINGKAGLRLLFPLVIIGIFSVFWWHHTEQLGAGDLRLYLLVQFYPVIFIPLIIILFPSTGNSQVLRMFIWIVLWYVVAKVLERFDKEVYNNFGFISGHSLKHLAAAVSTWYIVQLFKRKFSSSFIN